MLGPLLGIGTALLGGMMGGNEPEVIEGSTPFQALPEEVKSAFLNKFLPQALKTNTQLQSPAISQAASNVRNNIGSNLGGVGQQSLNNIFSLGNNLSSVDPNAFNFTRPLGQANELFNTARGFLGNAGTFAERGSKEVSPLEFNKTLEMFQNPFTQSVTNNAIRDLVTQATGIESGLDRQATLNGAFGGSRDAIRRAELDKNLLEQVGNLSAGLNASNFDQASGNALNFLNQGRSRNLAASSLFGNAAGLGFGGMGSLGNLAETTQGLQQGSALGSLGILGGLQDFSNQQAGALQMPTSFLGGALNQFPIGGPSSSTVHQPQSGLQKGLGFAQDAIGLASFFI